MWALCILALPVVVVALLGKKTEIVSASAMPPVNDRGIKTRAVGDPRHIQKQILRRTATQYDIAAIFNGLPPTRSTAYFPAAKNSSAYHHQGVDPKHGE